MYVHYSIKSRYITREYPMKKHNNVSILTLLLLTFCTHTHTHLTTSPKHGWIFIGFLSINVFFINLYPNISGIYKSTPQYLGDLSIPYFNARNLRSDMLLIAPCHPRAKLHVRSFQYAAPTVRNKLPIWIRESLSPNIFMTQLKNILFKSILKFYLSLSVLFYYYFLLCSLTY